MNNVIRQSKLFLNQHGAGILTILGGVGVVATAVTAVTATPKAMKLVEKAEKSKGAKLTKFEVVKTAAPVYIPSILIGTSTIACIFGANMLNKRKQASLMSAYALVDTSFKQYKDKVKELYGDDANDNITAEIAKDKYQEQDEKIEVEDGKQLFYDNFSERYFEATMDDILKGRYEINRLLTTSGYACINELYDYWKIPHIKGGDDIGWCSFANYEMYEYSWIDFHFNKTLIDDDLECTIINMFMDPYPEYMSY